MALIALFSVFPIGVIGRSNLDIMTVNNPYSVNEVKRSQLIFVPDEFKKYITTDLEIDKVEIDIMNIHSFEIIQGNIVDFDAHKNGKSIEGEFYFTEDTLEVLIYEENGKTEQVSIPTGE